MSTEKVAATNANVLKAARGMLTAEMQTCVSLRRRCAAVITHTKRKSLIVENSRSVGKS